MGGEREGIERGHRGQRLPHLVVADSLNQLRDVEKNLVRLEAVHGLAGKLSGDGVLGERFGEEDEGGRWSHVPPVQQVVQLVGNWGKCNTTQRGLKLQLTSGAF